MQLNFEAYPKQVEALRRWSDPVTREVVYGGAKFGGKSYLGANIIFFHALTYPNTFYFIAREELNDLRKYTIPTIEKVFNDWGIKLSNYARYNGQDNYYQLHNGSRVYLLSCKKIPSDPLYERFGSMEMTQGWIEEGGEVAELAYANLKASLGRKNNKEHGLKAKLLITCNPKKNWIYRDFYKPFAQSSLPEDKAFIQAFAWENLKGDQDYIENILAKIKDRTMRERLYLGNWEYSADPSNLIEYEKIINLFRNHHVPGGNGYITCDVARFGRDFTIIMVWSGWQVIEIVRMDRSKMPEVANEIRRLQTKYRIATANVVVDEDGVGGGVVDILSCEGFVNNSSPVGDDNFDNLKSQCYFKLADRINDNGIWVQTEDSQVQEDITEELEVVRQKAVDNDKKKAVMPKDEVKKILGRSPDYSDCLMLREYFDLNKYDLDW